MNDSLGPAAQGLPGPGPGGVPECPPRFAETGSPIRDLTGAFRALIEGGDRRDPVPLFLAEKVPGAAVPPLRVLRRRAYRSPADHPLRGTPVRNPGASLS
jgi:hypothetical protein